MIVCNESKEKCGQSCDLTMEAVRRQTGAFDSVCLNAPSEHVSVTEQANVG